MDFGKILLYCIIATIVGIIITFAFSRTDFLPTETRQSVTLFLLVLTELLFCSIFVAFSLSSFQKKSITVVVASPGYFGSQTYKGNMATQPAYIVGWIGWVLLALFIFAGLGGFEMSTPVAKYSLFYLAGAFVLSALLHLSLLKKLRLY